MNRMIRPPPQSLSLSLSLCFCLSSAHLSASSTSGPPWYMHTQGPRLNDQEALFGPSASGPISVAMLLVVRLA